MIVLRVMRRVLLRVMLLLLWSGAAVAIQALDFKDTAEQQRFRSLTLELRCMVCQNESLAESSAPLADDLRREVLEQMRTGKSDTEVREFLLQRYGDFVLYKPRFAGANIALWLAPPLFLLLALWVWRSSLQRRVETDNAPPADDLQP
jgi:cytochrome c-type biogenesis protein CcmH